MYHKLNINRERIDRTYALVDAIALAVANANTVVPMFLSGCYYGEDADQWREPELWQI